MWRFAAMVVALAACGRFDFDGVARDATYAMPSVVQTQTSHAVAQSISVQLGPPSSSGDGLVVAVAGYFEVTAVADDAGDAFAQLVAQTDSNADTARRVAARRT
jgi:hypothetical protein